MLKRLGTMTLGNKVDITDPCYNKDVWCRMTVDCEPGEYNGYVFVSDEDGWGMRVSEICISKSEHLWDINDMEHIGDIGVDAGMAGFFNNKPDFNDDEWDELCSIADFKSNAWNAFNGIFSSSGYGDGMYPVYASLNRDAFVIVFIDKE